MNQRMYPVVKDIVDERDHVAAPPGNKLPVTVDLSEWLGPVKDQENLGACTGFAFCGLREFLYRKFLAYEKAPIIQPSTPVFSPLFLYYEERLAEGDVGTDSGAQSRTGLKVLAKVGVCLESSDPYQTNTYNVAPTDASTIEAAQFKIGAYHRVPDLATLKGVLASGYCSSLAIKLFTSFESDAVAESGVVPMPLATEQNLGGHEVLAYGYDETKRVVLVRNSWGSYWGNKGNFELPYEYFDQSVMDMWTAHLGRPWMLSAA